MNYLKILILFLISCYSYGQHYDYSFTGNLKVELSQHMQNITGETKPVDLSGVEVRVVRAKGTKLKGKTADAVTGPNGDFSITKKFARDRDGALPGNKPIRFNIDVRFRNDNLKIRKGGLGKVNWYTIARVEDKDGGSNDLKTLVFNRDSQRELNNELASKHAQIYWIYQKAINHLNDKNIGFSNTVGVTYPQKNPIKDKSYAIYNIYLSEDANPGNKDEPRVMMHELMHIWHVQNMPWNETPKCILDGHHNDPDNLFPSVCSGFMEGMAEALGIQLAHDLFGYKETAPYSFKELRNAKNKIYTNPKVEGYDIEDIRDAERSDLGWYNMFAFILSNDEWSHFDDLNIAAGVCDPKDLSLYEILRAIKNENINPGQMSMSRLANILERRAGLSQQDATIYQKLGDPAGNPLKIVHEECTDCQNLPDTHTLIIAGNEWNGSSDYDVEVSGTLMQLSGNVNGYNATVQGDDNTKTNTASGAVGGGVDAFCFTGNLNKINLKNPCAAVVYVDGKQRDLGCSDCGDDPNSHTIVIAGNEGSGSTDYDIKVSGDIRQIGGKTEGYSASIQDNDNVSGKTASGAVGNGVDAFCFKGSLDDINLKDPCAAAVYVDGKKKEVGCKLEKLEAKPKLDPIEIDKN